MEISSSLSRCSITTKYQTFFFSTSTGRTSRFSSYTSNNTNNNSSKKRSNWNSNAETSRYKRKTPTGDATNFGFKDQKRTTRSWWWLEEDESLDDEDDDDFDSNFGSRGGILEETIDSIWIFKVFRSYGWTFPVIILSMLLATGPKAFLMALALPLGQSALFYAIDKVFGRTRDRPKPRARNKRRPFVRTASNVETEEEDVDGINGTGEVRKGYQSWVATADGDSAKKGGNQRMPSFGGWEELDRGQESNKERKRRTVPRQSLEKGKLSRRRGRQKDTPLLLRLLIAVFPFLGSWTKLI